MEPASARRPWTRPWGAVVTLAVLGAVAWPASRPPIAGDDFPLSTYPMFASRRKDARVVLDYVIATGLNGQRVHVPPSLIAGPEVMQAMMTINRAVSGGRAQALCAQVAARLVGRRAYDRYDTVKVMTGDHLAVDYLTRGVRGRETERASCAIVRSEP